MVISMEYVAMGLWGPSTHKQICSSVLNEWNYALDEYIYVKINSTAAKTANATCLVFVCSDAGEGYALSGG